MSLKGNLATVNLVEVFQVLAKSNSTGLLRIQAPEGARFVEIQNGAITLAGRAADRRLLGDLLLARGLIEKKDLEAALASQATSGKLLGQHLIEMGIIEMAVLEQVLQFQVEEEVCELFRLKEGEFDFLGNAALDAKLAAGGGLVRLHLDAGALLAQATQRAEEWKAVEVRVPSQASLFRLTAIGQQKVQDETTVSEEGRILLRLVEEQRTVEAMVQKACLGRLTTNRMLVELWDAGFIEPMPLEDYNKVAKRHLSLSRFEEAQRVVDYVLTRPDDNQKTTATSILHDILKSKVVKPSSLYVSTGGKITTVRPARNLIIKKSNAGKYWALGVACLLLAAGAVVYFFLLPARSVKLLPERQEYESLVGRADGLFQKGDYAGCLELMRNFRSPSPELQKLVNEHFSLRQKDIEDLLVKNIHRFRDAQKAAETQKTAATAADLADAAEKLQPLIDLAVSDPRLEMDQSRARKDLLDYHESVRVTAFYQRVQDLRAGEAAQDKETQQKAYRALLADDPPEVVAVGVRDLLANVDHFLAEGARLLTQAQAWQQAGDVEAALAQLTRVAEKWPRTSLAAAAKKDLAACEQATKEARARWEEIGILCDQKKDTQAQAALLKLLDFRPPQALLTQAQEKLQGLRVAAEAKAERDFTEARALYARQPAEGRAKIIQLLAECPYSRAALNASLKVKVTSVPEGAEVCFQGRPPVRTPVVLDVPCVGLVHFSFKKDGPFALESITQNNFRDESLRAVLPRLPVLAKRMPAPAALGLRVTGEQAVLADANEVVFCERRELKVSKRLKLPALQASAGSVTPGAYAWTGLTVWSTPIMSQALLSTGDNCLLRLKMESGEFTRVPLGAPPVTAPMVFTPLQFPDKKFIGVATLQAFHCLDFEKGEVQRRVPLGEPAKEAAQGTAFDGSACFYARGATLEVFPPLAGPEKWHAGFNGEIVGTLALQPAKGMVAAVDRAGHVAIFSSVSGQRSGERDLGGPCTTGCVEMNETCFAVVRQDGQVFCLNWADGAPAWQVSLNGTPRLAPQALGRPGAPAQALLCCTRADDQDYLNVVTPAGVLLWRATLNSRPLAVDSDGARIYAGTEDGDVTVYEIR